MDGAGREPGPQTPNLDGGSMLCKDSTLEKRLWRKVDKCGPVPAHRPELGSCWIWTGSTNQSGYGLIGTSVGLRTTHHVAWKLAGNEISDGKKLCHFCDVPNCVRLSHLFVGTHQDNMLDMETKGRGRHPSGDEHYKSRLKPEQVREIRKLWAEGVPQTKLSKMFQREPNTISKIVNRKRWGDL